MIARPSAPSAPCEHNGVSSTRSVALDVFRGLMLFLLLPDPKGGFSLPRIAPEVVAGDALTIAASQLQHTVWTGLTLWDLIMPAFLMIAGAAIAHSYASRRRRCESGVSFALHAGLRCSTLILLGLAMSLRADTSLTEFWPLLMLAPALRFEGNQRRQSMVRAGSARSLAAALIWGTVLIITAVRLAPFAPSFAVFEAGHLLVQLGLASTVTFLLVRTSAMQMLAAALLILFIWWLAFALHEPRAIATEAAGVTYLIDGGLQGFFARWNPYVNFASSADLWFFNLWPRPEPFLLSKGGLQFFNFVPSAATVLIGAVAGRTLMESRDARTASHRLMIIAIALIVFGGLLAAFAVPIVKSVWSTSYALLTAGLCIFALSIVGHLVARGLLHRTFAALAILGSNALLLYVLTLNYRWRILEPLAVFRQLRDILGPAWPLFESAFVLAALWSLAYALHRLGVRVRL
jgi:heparan-alpha-glucosaminide N-acetyltransferase